MISICIPIYNFNVNSLVESLQTQISNLEVPCELILIDDCSSIEFKELNKQVCKKFTYVELNKNIGRSKIRNLFQNLTQYEYLLFLDCDSLIENNLFLENYIYYLKNSPSQVLVGGRVYPGICPSKNQKLSWKYGINKESKSYAQRSEYPNKSFMTNNFVIQKELFQELHFNEALVGYGHEDTLFGIELQKKGISIDHIHNPVLNGDIETNEKFLIKTEKAIENLIYIQKNIDSSALFEENINLIKVFNEFKKNKKILVVGFIYKIFGRAIKYTLKKGFISLLLFDIYKLAYYTKLRN